VKGIILAGGSGTRLYPNTQGVSKQLLPMYDKPMIYYPLSMLLLAGVRDVLVITTPDDSSSFKRLLNDGSQFGINIHYAEQSRPEGIAQAFIIGRSFVGNDRVVLALGDNLFFGHGLTDILKSSASREKGATVFAYRVGDPERYGVIEMDQEGKAISIEEKPITPKSHYAVTGMYFYDNDVLDIAQSLQPSERGELEISDINKIYLDKGLLNVERLGRGIAWLDTGTSDALMQAAHFIQTLQQRQGLMVSCPEEIAWELGYITTGQLAERAKTMKQNNYGQYLLNRIKEHG